MNKDNLNPKAFYDRLSPDYDRMIHFEKRIKAERPVFEKFITKYPIKTALDAACGSGMHVVMLNQMGIDVTGADISAQMLDRAKENAKQRNCGSRFVRSSMQELPEKISGTFDAVFCLGNSLPHLLHKEDLKQALAGFYKLLNPGGVAIIGMLNFARVRANNERILSVNQAGDTEYIRFYDIGEKSFFFNILTINRQDGKATHHLQTTELKPYAQTQLEDALINAGFKENNFWGSLRMEPFNESSSKNLVIVSQK